MNMPSAQKMLLGDVVRFGNGKSIKPGGVGRYLVFGSNGIIGGCDEFRHENGIIIGRVGAYCGAVVYCPSKFWASDNTLVAYPANGQFDTKFLFYMLSDAKLSRYAGGAAQPLVTQTVLKQVEVRVLPLPTQRRIAGILSAYDELIENSQRRIKILEAMARGLYREWFVHFRFPGHENQPRVASALGEIPQGWEVRSIKDVAVVTYGFPFQSKKFNINQIGLPVIRIRDILDASTTTFTDEVAEAKYHIKNGDILVGMDGDFHMCIWSSGHSLQNQRIAKFESRSAIGNHLLFLALELPIQTWNKSIVGTTVAHLGDMHIKSIQIVWPTEHILKMANRVLEPMAEQIIALKRQIQNLRRTRDLLLPRLLSGQINVEAAEHV
jgi:type I restriction enzyme S subunit